MEELAGGGGGSLHRGAAPATALALSRRLYPRRMHAASCGRPSGPCNCKAPAAVPKRGRALDKPAPAHICLLRFIVSPASAAAPSPSWLRLPRRLLLPPVRWRGPGAVDSTPGAGGRGPGAGGRGPGTVWSTYPPLPGEGGWFYEICMCVFYGSGSSSHSLAPLSPLLLSPAPWRPGGQGEKIKTEREGGGAGGAGGGTGGPWRDPSPHSVPTPRSRDTHLLLLHLHHLVQAEVVGSYPRVVHLVKAHDDRVPDTRLVRRHDLPDLVEPV